MLVKLWPTPAKLAHFLNQHCFTGWLTEMSGIISPTNTRRWHNVGLLLDQHWVNSHIVFAGTAQGSSRLIFMHFLHKYIESNKHQSRKTLSQANYIIYKAVDQHWV